MLIGAIAELCMLKSAKVLICDGIEVTPMYVIALHATLVSTKYKSYTVLMCIATKLSERN